MIRTIIKRQPFHISRYFVVFIRNVAEFDLYLCMKTSMPVYVQYQNSSADHDPSHTEKDHEHLHLKLRSHVYQVPLQSIKPCAFSLLHKLLTHINQHTSHLVTPTNFLQTVLLVTLGKKNRNKLVTRALYNSLPYS